MNVDGPFDSTHLASEQANKSPPITTTCSKRPRQRRWSTKSKTGCITCRMRRVKCDERKPTCSRCISSKRQCDGYSDNLSQFPTLLLQPGCGLPPLFTDSPSREKQIFHLFRNDTVYHIPGAFDRSFWNFEVLQASQAYPAVWHAVLATASIYTWMSLSTSISVTESTRQEYYIEGLDQYNISMKHLVIMTQQQPDPTYEEQQIILLTTLLLLGVCSLRGDIKEAITFGQHGLRLFNQWNFGGSINQNWPASSPNILSGRSLIGLFERVRSQNFWLGVNTPSRTQFELLRTPSTAPFTSLTDAYFELLPLLNCLLELPQASIESVFVRHAKPAPDICSEYRTAVSAWRSKFERLQKLSTPDVLNSECAVVLQMFLSHLEMGLDLETSKGEVSWDKFTPAYEHIVSVAEKYFEESPFCKTQDINRPYFSFSLSVCETLCVVGSNCRLPSIRRRALGLLKKWWQRDGIWDSKLLASIIEKKMKLEEDYCSQSKTNRPPGCTCIVGSFICNDHRVFHTAIEFSHENNAIITLSTLGVFKNSLSPSKIEIQW